MICSMDNPLETIVSLLHIERQVSSLLLTQLLAGLHLIQRDQPLDDFPPVLKVLIRDLVDGLNDIAQQWV